MIGRDGVSRPLSDNAGGWPPQPPVPVGSPQLSRAELIDALASREDMDPEQLEALIEEAQKPAVMGFYEDGPAPVRGVIGHPSDYDPAAEMLAARGLMPGRPGYRPPGGR